MTISVPLLIGIVIAAVVIGLLLGRRRRRIGVIRPSKPAVRMIRPPTPTAGSGSAAPASAEELAEMFNRASDEAHLKVHVTPEMFANAKVTSNVHVSTSEGTLDPAAARQMLDAVSRMMAAGGSGGTPGQLSPEIEREVRGLIGQGKMINAVKLVRDSTGLDLLGAKNIVDALR